MTKTALKYRVASGYKPGTTEVILRPVITERPTMYVDQFVEWCLNAGYVRGQFHDMKGALNGFIQGMQEAGKAGYAVNLSNWLRIHAELTGRVGEDRTLTAMNGLNVNITALTDLKADINNFTWTNVDDTGLRVKVESVLSPGGVPGQIIKTKGILLTGKNLKFDAALGDSIVLTYEGLTTPITITPTESDYAHMLCAWPTLLADVDPDTEITIKVTSRGGVSGAPDQVNTRMVVLKAA